MFRNFRLLSKVCLRHADTRMTRGAYAHLAPSYVAANFPRLELSSDSKVIPMRCDPRIRNA
jgi:hypothetical protein